MVIKRYIVSSMNEAMTRIRYELGKDAVIVSQRKIRKSGIKGFFSKKVIEVTAAVEKVKNSEEDLKESLEAIKQVVAKERANSQITSRGKLDNSEVSVDLLREIQEMKGLISEMVDKSPEKLQRKTKFQIKLEASDLSDKVIQKITDNIKAMNENLDEIQKAQAVIEKMVTVSKAKMEGPIVLVGPTGVGKTTTIAKLAGRLTLIEKKKVGLITIDTYRIGAVEQLKTYADIINIPFRVVFSIKEMEAAVESMKNCDIVLIDTTGRSSKNTMQISELRAFINKVNTENIHLVISCTTKNKDINSIIEGYRVLNYNNIIITKLDETTTYGSVLNILETAKKPVSFVTVGQNVPDDIKCITPQDISNLILGDYSIC